MPPQLGVGQIGHAQCARVATMIPMKRRLKDDPSWEDSELLFPGLPEPDLSDLERWHDPAFGDRLVDILTSVAGLADARDPDPTALLHASDPPSRREQ